MRVRNALSTIFILIRLYWFNGSIFVLEASVSLRIPIASSAIKQRRLPWSAFAKSPITPSWWGLNDGPCEQTEASVLYLVKTMVLADPSTALCLFGGGAASLHCVFMTGSKQVAACRILIGLAMWRGIFPFRAVLSIRWRKRKERHNNQAKSFMCKVMFQFWRKRLAWSSASLLAYRSQWVKLARRI